MANQKRRDKLHEGNLVICDQEQQYARNLLQMFARNRETEVQMYLFHTIEEVERFAKQKPVHTLLISREYPQGKREQIPAEERFVLVKNMQDSLAENEVGIYRYQSAEDIWQQMCNGSESIKNQKICKPENPKTTEKRQRKENPEPREKKQRLGSPESGERRRRSESPEPGEERRRPESLESGKERRRLESPEPGEKRRRLESPEPGKKRRRPENPGFGETIWKTENLQVRDRRQSQEEPEVRDNRQSVQGNCQTRTKGELIGVYSPIHRIGKTRFALELGKELARKEPVLYLNLEEYSGGSYYFPDETGQTLADLLYYARQEKGNLGLRISTMAGQDGELDYILPMPYVQDLQGVSGEEWLKLFEKILENCIYQKVILDLGDSVNGLFQILEICHTVYTPYIEDELARAKLNQYAENLRKTGREKVLEKTVQKKLKQR